MIVNLILNNINKTSVNFGQSRCLVHPHRSQGHWETDPRPPVTFDQIELMASMTSNGDAKYRDKQRAPVREIQSQKRQILLLARSAGETGMPFFVLLRIALKVIEDKPRREYLGRQGNLTLSCLRERNAVSVARGPQPRPRICGTCITAFSRNLHARSLTIN